MSHETWMRRAIQAAGMVRGSTAPNPRVGAVVVLRNRLVSVGWHEGPGTAHAEVMALERAGEHARGATLYCTLEPCCHDGEGKHTPPCVPRIIESGVTTVVCATLDPNPKVRGGGLAALERAGIRVVDGVADADAAAVNEGFFQVHLTGRPLVRLKLVQTLDGFLGPLHGSSGHLSGPVVDAEVHRLRASHDAVMVGAGTLRADNPRLTVRIDHSGQQPVRVVVAGQKPVPADCAVFTDLEARTILYLTEASLKTLDRGLRRFARPVAAGENGLPDPAALLEDLGRLGMTTVLCEGGSSFAASLLTAGLADWLSLVTVPRFGGTGVAALAGAVPESPGAWGIRGLERPVIRSIDGAVWIDGRLTESPIPAFLRKTEALCLPA